MRNGTTITEDFRGLSGPLLTHKFYGFVRLSARRLICNNTTASSKTNKRYVSLSPHTLYVLDEPTVGLHMADVEKLIHVLHRLVEAGSTVILIEHNLDPIAEADWIIDMGPEGGTGGGNVVVAGDVPTLLKARAKSHTGAVLAEFLQ